MSTKQKPCDWIIYYNESKPHGKYVKYVPVGASIIHTIRGTVLKGFHGTKSECEAEANRMNREFVESFTDTKRHYIRQRGD